MRFVQSLVLAAGVFGEAAPESADSFKYPWQRLGADVLKQHANVDIPVADFSKPAPKIRIGGRVVDLFSGDHFDDLLRDTPNEMRPGSLVVFHSNACKAEFKALNLFDRASKELPSRGHLLVATYNLDAAPLRSWYKFTPEMDLAARFKVHKCPAVVYAARVCNGHTQWCVKEENSHGPNTRTLGCANFKESCNDITHWDGQGDWVQWAKAQVAMEEPVKINALWKEMKYNDLFIRARDEQTSVTHLRNSYMARAVPPFTPSGFKVVDIPPELHKLIMEFYEKARHRHREVEDWDLTDTQNSFHETIMWRISWDLYKHRDQVADKYLKPLLEEWSGVKGLKLTAFYGIREYDENHWLRKHIDRTETHVISATLSLAKMPFEDQKKEDLDPNAWPLEVIDFDGNAVEYDHPPGKMVLYESAKVPHGRPKRNPHSGGYHVGIFAHFAPPEDYVDWQQVQDFAEHYHQQFAKNTPFMATPSEEPAVPTYTNQQYGLHANDDGIAYKPETEHDHPDALRDVFFSNGSHRPLTLWWTNGVENHVQCEDVPPGDECSVGTYPGHNFFWTKSEHDQEKLPHSDVEVRVGKERYEYVAFHDDL